MPSPSLIISALFGLVQLAAGSVLVRRLVREMAWQNRNVVIGALAGAWLLTSGAGECVVAAVSQVQRQHPAALAQVRGVVDVTLLVVTLVLLIVFLLYPLLFNAHGKQSSLPPPPSHHKGSHDDSRNAAPIRPQARSHRGRTARTRRAAQARADR